MQDASPATIEIQGVTDLTELVSDAPAGEEEDNADEPEDDDSSSEESESSLEGIDKIENPFLREHVRSLNKDPKENEKEEEEEGTSPRVAQGPPRWSDECYTDRKVRYKSFFRDEEYMKNSHAYRNLYYKALVTPREQWSDTEEEFTEEQLENMRRRFVERNS